MNPNLKKYFPTLILLTSGFFLGPIGDFGHVTFGIASYPFLSEGTSFGPIPWWVPFEFGLATWAIGTIQPFLESKVSGGEVSLPPTWAVLLGPVLFIGQYLLSSFLPWPPGGGADVVMILVSLSIWLLVDRSKLGFIFSLGTMFVGTMIELSIIQTGHFTYYPQYSNLFNLSPTWLPTLYFTAGVTVGNLGKWLPHAFDSLSSPE